MQVIRVFLRIGLKGVLDGTLARPRARARTHSLRPDPAGIRRRGIGAVLGKSVVGEGGGVKNQMPDSKLRLHFGEITIGLLEAIRGEIDGPRSAWLMSVARSINSLAQKNKNFSEAAIMSSGSPSLP